MDRNEERAIISELIARIAHKCPSRIATGEDERRAQEMVADELKLLGLELETQQLQFNRSINANFALHFGLGVLGTAISGLFPLAGFLLHTSVAASYLADATRRGYLLRRLLGFRPAVNVLARLPARGEPALRIVFLAHADAGFTGWVFQPEVMRRFAHLPRALGLLRRPVRLATWTQASLGFFDLLRALAGPLTLPLRPLEVLLTLPSLSILLTNLEILLRNQVVPGAADNLTGVAALPVLARRLIPRRNPDVELVFVVTSCEEAGLGGADALARLAQERWDRERTVVVALDCLCHGDLCYAHAEGEVVRYTVPAWLEQLLRQVASSDPRFTSMRGFEPPLGGTDAGPFLYRGWAAVGLVCLDPDLGAPRHYHLPSDTPENIDPGAVLDAVDFTEKLALALMERKAATGHPLT